MQYKAVLYCIAYHVMSSIWTDTSEHPKFESLKKDIKTEVLIIGGGMAGILCAYMLDRAGVDYVLVEADRICSGVTKNTTAKITSQHGLIYAKLVRRFGREKAQLYLRANEEALNNFRAICRNIECDFEEKDSYVYSRSSRKKIEDEIKALDRIGFHAEFTDQLPMPFTVAGAVKFSEQAQFHPLKFLSAIAQNLHIYEQTVVREMVRGTVMSDYAKIKANHIIATTHFPFINKHGSYFLKLYQDRSYVLALTEAPNVHGIYVDEADKGLSFRNYKNQLLLGGGSHRTGKSGGCWQELRDFARQYYPGAKETYSWSAQDCMTLDRVPYIGRYSASTENFYVASGFNKWGMTSSMVAAMILSDSVQGRTNQYAPVFSPSRTMLRPQLAINAFEAVVHLLSFSKRRCPHMGCALKWNAPEHSWDCPCHGSRFSEDGKLIDNPATGDFKIKK